MTTVLLHGGYGGHWGNAGEDAILFDRLVKAAREADQKILMGFLSHETLEEFPFIETLIETFQRNYSDIELIIADRTSFKEHIATCQVVFLQGGNSREHSQFIKTLEKDLIRNDKYLLAGSSSGAMVLCHCGYSGGGDMVIEGKGIVDLAVIPHANSWPVDQYIPKLKQHTSYPILLVKENEFVEIEI